MIAHLKFAGIRVADQAAAVDEFTDKLGFVVTIDRPYGDAGGRWIEIRPPGAETGVVVFEDDDAPPAGTMGEVWFQTDDLDATYAELSERGVEFTVTPQEAPWDPSERWAQFVGPEGVLYGLS